MIAGARELSPDEVIERLRRPAAAGAVGGDHHLNPGMRPARDLTPAAVLVALVNRAGGLTTLFTRRTENLENHAGQISFPGGHREPGDDTPEETALRETEEEIGLHRRHVEVIGRLGRYVTRTGFAVTPVVALVEPPFELEPDPREVEDVFEVPLSFLLDPANHERHAHEVGGQTREFYAMPYEGYYIWGATAGMLVNLYQVLRDR
ncbi:MAG: NUDIX hydrolase [Rhodospirillales bacterium]